MIKDVEEESVEYAYFCGDLFHTHSTVSTQALAVAGELFRKLRRRGVKIRAIPGNHDMDDRQGDIHGLLFLPDDEISGHWVDGDLEVHALPFTTDEERLKRFLGDVGDGGGGMVLLHQGVAGVPLSSGWLLDEKLNPKMIPDNVRAFTGHYHSHKAVTPNLTVVGNLTPLTWGDIDQDKGWVIWDDVDGELSQRTQTASPYFIGYDRSQSLEVVQGSFVRYMEPVTAKEQPDIRAELLEEGALTVEFPELKTDKKQSKIRSRDGVTIEHVLGEIVDKDMDSRRREVGVEVREERYETPEV
jgi:DNA repair exonuclease SbcCD nuclease subunit